MPRLRNRNNFTPTGVLFRTLYSIILFALAVAVSACGRWIMPEKAPGPKERMLEIRKDKSNNIFYGEGSGATEQEARRNALNDLMSKLASTHDYGNTIIESQHNDEYDLHQTVSMSSVWRGSLEGVEEISYKKARRWYSMQYITSSTMEANRRKRLAVVETLIARGLREEENLELTKAMKHFLWALNMLCFYDDQLQRRFYGESEQDASEWIQNHIPEILDNIEVGIIEEPLESKGNGFYPYSAILGFSYKGRPIKSVEISYFNGDHEIYPVVVENGVGVLGFPSLEKISRIDLRIIYDSVEEALSYDKDLELAYSKGSLWQWVHNSFVSLAITRPQTIIPSVEASDNVVLQATDVSLQSVPGQLQQPMAPQEVRRVRDTIRRHTTSASCDTVIVAPLEEEPPVRKAVKAAKKMQSRIRLR